MSSAFPDGRRRPLAALVATLFALCGCAREERRFVETSPPGDPKQLRLTNLQAGNPGYTEEEPDPYHYNAYAISQGKKLFEWFNCSGCHAHGGGDSGPPLMDAKWIYGASPANIHASIVQGRPNGMPSFGGKIPEEQVWQIVAYVQALGGRLPRDTEPGRSDHLNARPGEQSFEPDPQPH